MGGTGEMCDRSMFQKTVDTPGPSQRLGRASDEEVADLIDAISGATWATRNRIMEERFLTRLGKSEDGCPAFKPPGQPIDSK